MKQNMSTKDKAGEEKNRRDRSRKDKNDKYHRILSAAIKVFAEQGFFNSTISQIAKEAGVADGTIYLYFKNKDDILLQFFNFKSTQVLDRFRKDVGEADDARSRLNSLVRSHLREFQKDPNMAVVFQTEARKGRHLENRVKNLTKMYLGIVGEIVEQGQEEGMFRRDLYFSLVKRFVLGSVDEVINAWVHSGSNYDLVSMADPLVDLLLRGIGSRSGKAAFGRDADTGEKT